MENKQMPAKTKVAVQSISVATKWMKVSNTSPHPHMTDTEEK